MGPNGSSVEWTGTDIPAGQIVQALGAQPELKWGFKAHGPKMWVGVPGESGQHHQGHWCSQGSFISVLLNPVETQFHTLYSTPVFACNICPITDFVPLSFTC